MMSSAARTWGICFSLLVLPSAWCGGPTGCTLLDGLYDCDHGSISLPLSEASFTSPVAQRIRISGISSLTSSNLFQSDFGSIDTAQFDTNWAPTLELKCSSGNSNIAMTSSLFQHMSHIRDLKIINCLGVSLQANTFSVFNILDRLVIENGTLNTIDSSALGDVDIVKLNDPTPTFPVRTGELVIMNSKLQGNTLPSQFLSQQNHMVRAVMEGMDLNFLDSSMFSNSTFLRFISLGYNSFTELPAGLFDGLSKLAELHLYDTQLDCTCSKLWFFEHAQNTKMKIYGDITCLSPDNWIYHRASSFYKSECVTAVPSCAKGIELSGACIVYFELAMYIVCVIAFILSIVVLGLVICIKRQLGGASSTRGKPGAKSKRTTKTTTKSTTRTTKKGWE